MTNALDVIHQDHVNLDKVLKSLTTLVAGIRLAPNGTVPTDDLKILHSILYYLRVFPDRLHHPKEEEFLFKPLGLCYPESVGLIAELEAQHVEGSKMLTEFDAALKNLEAGGEEGLMQFQALVEKFAKFQREHMGLEERELIPLAREHLGDTDLHQANRSFGQHSDPMFGENVEAGFRSLFSRITE